jgi:hypothetical protein
MYKNKAFLLMLILVGLTQFGFGQNNTNSPYTRFGFGELVNSYSANQRAMGGVAIGSRSNFNINSVNPASYSAVDTMTFMFDLGVTGLASHFSDPNGSKSAITANLEYITMQFPLAKWLGFSAGMLPYSFLGYNFFSKDSVPIDSNLSTQQHSVFTNSFVGQGGFTQVYTGLSANLFKHIAIGVNAYYMFGTISNNRYEVFSNTSNNINSSQINSITASNFRFRYGLQFYNTFAKKHDVTLGLIYEQKAKLNGDYSSITFGALNDTIDKNHPNYTDYGFELPETYGLGLYYTYDKRISVGVDYSMEKWAETKFYGKTDSLNNRSKIAIGFEYLPNPFGRKYADRITYRVGFNTSSNYFKVNGLIPPDNFGISLGVGLPMYDKVSRAVTMLNASLEYGKIGSNTLLREDYLKLTLNVTFNEHWFFKRKL